MMNVRNWSMSKIDDEYLISKGNNIIKNEKA